MLFARTAPLRSTRREQPYPPAMPEMIEVSFELTRDDWIGVNEACVRESPAWEAAAAAHRKSSRRTTLFMLPVITAGAAVFLGRSQGMYIEGALLGAAFGLFLLDALPRVNVIDKQKRDALTQVRSADLSEYVGATTVKADSAGVWIRTPTREMKLAWAVASVSKAGDYFIVNYANGGGAIVPRRAFASEADRDDFFKQATEWWSAAQLPGPDRIARYVADRDVACLKCAYNLRGVRTDSCPECGTPLLIDELVSAQAATPRRPAQ